MLAAEFNKVLAFVLCASVRLENVSLPIELRNLTHSAHIADKVRECSRQV
jgi:hypothetical protein